jgi:hypothetical protein
MLATASLFTNKYLLFDLFRLHLPGVDQHPFNRHITDHFMAVGSLLLFEAILPPIRECLHRQCNDRRSRSYITREEKWQFLFNLTTFIITMTVPTLSITHAICFASLRTLTWVNHLWYDSNIRSGAAFYLNPYDSTHRLQLEGQCWRIPHFFLYSGLRLFAELLEIIGTLGIPLDIKRTSAYLGMIGALLNMPAYGYRAAVTIVEHSDATKACVTNCVASLFCQRQPARSHVSSEFEPSLPSAP